MVKFSYEIHIPATIIPYPEKYEVSAAGILVRHFNSDVYFVSRKQHKTPDFLIGNIFWELKSPVGNGKRNIQRTLQDALTQSTNIIFDARRSKLHQNKIRNELQYQFTKTKKIKRLLLITKDGGVIEFKR